MVRAVIWDFGGVFTTSPFEAFARYERERGIPEGFIRTVNATDPDTNAWARFERSQLGYDEFDAAFREESAALGHAIPGRDVIALLAGDVRPEMVRALDLVRARLKCACITNNVRAGEGPGITFTAEKTRTWSSSRARRACASPTRASTRSLANALGSSPPTPSISTTSASTSSRPARWA